MRTTTLCGVFAAALAGAVGCGAEPGDVADNESNEVGQTEQELRNGLQAFMRVTRTGSTAELSTTVAGSFIATSRTGLGKYTVTLTDLQTAGTPGNVQVVALGEDNVRCTASAARRGGRAVAFDVMCGTSTDVADSAFVARYAKASGASLGSGAYLTVARGPAPAVSNPWNSTAGVNTVSRPPGTEGRYTVVLPGFTTGGGTVQLTSMAELGGEHCTIGGWFFSQAGVTVDVRCFDSFLRPATTGFSLNFIAQANSVGFQTRGAFLWANDPTSALYFPNATFSKNTGNTAGSCSATNYAGQYADKTYWIRHDFLPRTAGSPHVSVYGTEMNYCKLRSFTGPADGLYVDLEVRCFDAIGQPVDSRYVETYAIRDSAGPC